jgi:hypothetical protein
VRALPLLFALLACDQPPGLESDPNVVWFRSSHRVSQATAVRIRSEVNPQPDWWAGPVYLYSSGRSGDAFLLGHQKLHLREYEVAVGTLRGVDAIDDRFMACDEARRLLLLLSGWAREFDTGWSVQLGTARGEVPSTAARKSVP